MPTDRSWSAAGNTLKSPLNNKQGTPFENRTAKDNYRRFDEVDDAVGLSRRASQSRHSKDFAMFHAEAEIIPRLVKDVISYVIADAHDVPDLFSRPLALESKLVKLAYEGGEEVDLSTVKDPRDVANVIKLYLKELPKPLVSEAIAAEFYHTQDIVDGAQRILWVQGVLRKMSNPQLTLLYCLMTFLHRISLESDLNGMSRGELGQIFGPLIFRTTKPEDNHSAVWATELLITHNDDVFSGLGIEPPLDFEHVEDDGDDYPLPREVFEIGYQGREVQETRRDSPVHKWMWRCAVVMLAICFLILVGFTALMMQYTFRKGEHSMLHTTIVQESFKIESTEGADASLIMDTGSGQVTTMSLGVDGLFQLMNGDTQSYAIDADGVLLVSHQDYDTIVESNKYKDGFGAIRMVVDGGIKALDDGIHFPDGTQMTTAAVVSEGSVSSKDLNLGADAHGTGHGAIIMSCRQQVRVVVTNEGEMQLRKGILSTASSFGLRLNSTIGGVTIHTPSSIDVHAPSGFNVNGNMNIQDNVITTINGDLTLSAQNSINVNPGGNLFKLSDSSTFQVGSLSISNNGMMLGSSETLMIQGTTVGLEADVKLPSAKSLTIGNDLFINSFSLSSHSSSIQIRPGGADVIIEDGKVLKIGNGLYMYDSRLESSSDIYIVPETHKIILGTTNDPIVLGRPLPGPTDGQSTTIRGQDAGASGSTGGSIVLMTGRASGGADGEIRLDAGNGKLVVDSDSIDLTAGGAISTKAITTEGQVKIAPPTFAELDPLLSVDGNGSFSGKVSASSFVETSDAKFKTDILDYEGGLAKVENLRGVTFSWGKNAPVSDRHDRREAGFLAQEVQAIVPEIVEVVGDADSADASHLAVDYGKVSVVLVEAVKELSKKVSRLEQENSALRDSLQAKHEQNDDILMRLSRLEQALAN